MFLASVIISSSFITVMRLTSAFTCLICLTASTILPVPGSPFVRNIAAPSPMRRAASPKLRQPQTNGTVKVSLRSGTLHQLVLRLLIHQYSQHPLLLVHVLLLYDQYDL